MMAHTLGGTLQLSENLLCLDKLNATMPLEDVETLLIEEPGVLSSTNTSDDQDEEALASDNNTAKSHRMAEANRRRLYRRMQTRERHELRRQVIDIEKELVLLRRAKENEKAQFNAAQTSTFWFWKSIAAQQRHERFLAEEENQVLTISTHTQAAYIRTLVNIARMPENNPTASRGQDQAVSDHRKQHCGVSETDLFGAFIQGLDTNCNHVDELLQAYRSTPQFEARNLTARWSTASFTLRKRCRFYCPEPVTSCGSMALTIALISQISRGVETFQIQTTLMLAVIGALSS